MSFVNSSLGQTAQEKAIEYARNGEYDRAAPFFLEDYDDAINQNDTLRIIQSARLLGNVFNLLSDSQNSYKYFQISLKLAESYDDDYVYLQSLMGTSYYHVYNDNTKKALKYSRIAVDLVESTNNAEILADTLSKGSVYLNLGAAYGRLGEIQEALKNYLIAAQYYEQFDNPILELSTLYCNIGDCYDELGQKEKSLAYYQEALSIAVDLNRLKDIRYALKQLYSWHKSYGNSERALEYLEKYTELKDTMLNESVIRSIEEMNTRFESGRLKDEISELNIKNKKSADTIENFSFWIWILIVSVILIGFIFLAFILRQYYMAHNRKLAFEKDQAELKQRVLTAQMNPHFLFNSLNSIQRMYLEGNTSDASDFMADFGSLLRKVLQYSELDRIPLSEDLEVLRIYLGLEKRRSDTDFQFEIEMDPEIDPSFLKVPPMIVQPFVENAIWHGIMPLKHQGLIQLKYTLNGSYLECVVTDNGVGYENSQHQRKQGHISKGVRITKDRLASLPNAISIKQTGEQGTQVIIKIPLTA